MRVVGCVILLIVGLINLPSGLACEYYHACPYLENLRPTANPTRFLVELKSHNSEERKNLVIDTTTHELVSPTSNDNPVNLSLPTRLSQTYKSDFLFLDNKTFWILLDQKDQIIFNVSIPMNITSYWQWFVSEHLSYAFIVFAESDWYHYNFWGNVNGMVIPIDNETTINSFTVQWYFGTLMNPYIVYDDEQLIYVRGDEGMCIDGYFYRYSNHSLEYILLDAIWSQNIIDLRVKNIISLNSQEYTNEVVIIDYNSTEDVPPEKIAWTPKELTDTLYPKKTVVSSSTIGSIALSSSVDFSTSFALNFIVIMSFLMIVLKRKR